MSLSNERKHPFRRQISARNPGEQQKLLDDYNFNLALAGIFFTTEPPGKMRNFNSIITN